MKTTLVLICALCLSTPAFAKEKKDKPIFQQCPTTKMTESCLDCHTIPDFKLKPKRERDPYEAMSTPYKVKWVTSNDGKPVLYYKLEEINDVHVFGLFEYARQHKAKHIVIEVFSPGGSLLNAWRIVGLMKQAQGNGVIVETRCHGFAASAGFLIFVSGTKGHRYVSPQAELMWHELITGEFLAIKTPSDKEDEARILRHLQDTGNEWLAEVSKLSKDEWDSLIRKKEFWLNGRQAVEKHGVADGYL